MRQFYWRMFTFKFEQLGDHIRRKPGMRIVNKNPCVEIVPPIGKSFMEVSLNFLDRLRHSHLVRSIDLEQRSFRFQVPVVLSISDPSPRSAGKEIFQMSFGHDSNEQVLECCRL